MSRACTVVNATIVPAVTATLWNMSQAAQT
jgi:hypothetical protein